MLESLSGPSHTRFMATRARSGIHKPIDHLNLHTVSTPSPLPRNYFQAFQNPKRLNVMKDKYVALILTELGYLYLGPKILMLIIVFRY